MTGSTRPHGHVGGIQGDLGYIHGQTHLDGAGAVNRLVFLGAHGDGRPALAAGSDDAIVTDNRHGFVAALVDQLLIGSVFRHNGSGQLLHIVLLNNNRGGRNRNALYRLGNGYGAGGFFVAAILGSYSDGGSAGALGSYQAAGGYGSHGSIGRLKGNTALIRIGGQHRHAQLVGTVRFQVQFSRLHGYIGNQHGRADLHQALCHNAGVFLGGYGNGRSTVVNGSYQAGIANDSHVGVAAAENHIFIRSVSRLNSCLQLLGILKHFYGYFRLIQGNTGYRHVNSRSTNLDRAGSRFFAAVGSSSRDDSRTFFASRHKSSLTNSSYSLVTASKLNALVCSSRQYASGKLSSLIYLQLLRGGTEGNARGHIFYFDGNSAVGPLPICSSCRNGSGTCARSLHIAIGIYRCNRRMARCKGDAFIASVFR